MKIGDITELAFRNLREAILRNSLTTLGVAVGVASLVAMLSVGVGLQQFASNKLASSGLFNAIFVMSRADRGFEPGRHGPAGQHGRTDRAPAVDEAAWRELDQLPNVTEVYPQIRFMTDVRYDNTSFPTSVAGVAASAKKDGAFDGMQGKFFSGPNANEAILQIDFAKELSTNASKLIGRELVLRYAKREALPAITANAGMKDAPNSSSTADAPGGGFSVVPQEKRLKIIGIIATEPEGGFGGFARVFIPLNLAENLSATEVTDLQQLVSGTAVARTYSSLTVRVKDPTEVQGTEAQIRKMGFATFSLLDTTRDLELFFTVVDLLLGIFGSLALAVATLGIVNTLVMAILERRREIGVFKALGADDRDVKQLFFAEAGVMGLIGGIAGVLLGWLIGRGLTFGTNVYLGNHQLPSVQISAVPLWLALGAIGFAVVVSLCAGLYPASRAARLNPIEALRYE